MAPNAALCSGGTHSPADGPVACVSLFDEGSKSERISGQTSPYQAGHSFCANVCTTATLDDRMVRGLSNTETNSLPGTPAPAAFLFGLHVYM